jgi:hypothetical protein
MYRSPLSRVGEELVFITEIAFTYPKLSFNIRINRDKERG